MAAPNVTGTAALIKSLNPEYTPGQIYDIIRDTARQTGTLGFDEQYGYGAVNSYAAVLGIDKLNIVVYNYNDNIREPVSVRVVHGDYLFEPFAPELKKHEFIGWSTYAEGGNLFSFSWKITGSMTLYAQWEKLPIDFIYGDLNGDGEIDLADLMLLRRHLAGWTGLGINLDAADINDDGDVDLADLMLLRRRLAS